MEQQKTWKEAIDMVLDVIYEMQESFDYHNPTLDQLETELLRRDN